MAQSGKVNGHKPEQLMRTIGAGAGNLGIADIPTGAAGSVAAVTGLRSQIPPDAHTAPYLGTERLGNAVVIDDHGLILTVGYLLLECSHIEIADADDDWVEAAFVGYDFETGFGLARASRSLGLGPATLGDSAKLAVDDQMIVAGRGGQDNALRVRVASRRPFSGYWEYYLDDAIFTVPAHPDWGGSALVASDGAVVAIGSLLVEDANADEEPAQGNMFMPVDLFTSIRDELVADGRVNRPPRPWLGMFTAEAQGVLVVTHTTKGGPAEDAGIEAGDLVVRVDAGAVSDLADLYQRVWQMGESGVDIPLTLVRRGASIEVSVESADRYDFFRTPRL